VRRLKIQLRKRWHNRPILAKVGSVIESDFIIRQLYKDVYFTDFYFLSISLFILLTICTVCVLSTLHKDHDDDDFRDANTTAARVCNSYSYVPTKYVDRYCERHVLRLTVVLAIKQCDRSIELPRVLPSTKYRPTRQQLTPKSYSRILRISAML